MKNSRVALLIALAVAAFPLTAGAQAAGRISVKVVDSEGSPLSDVRVTVTSPDLEAYLETASTNKKGKVLMSHSDSTLSYAYKFEKEGFQPVVEILRATIRGVTERTVVMMPAGTARADQPVTPEHQAVLAYNAGAEAQLAGDLETADQRFRRAAEIDPTLAIAHTGLAGVFFLQERWPEAVAEAERALELDPGDERALQLRYEAYLKAGETAKAAEAAEALAGSGASTEVAGRAYNEAVDAYRTGDRAKARRMLEEAVVVNPGLVQPRVFLAAICREEGDLDRAEIEVAAVLEREPANPLALRLGYEIAAVRGDWETEKAMAQKLVEADPVYAGSQFLSRSIELYDGNHFDEAATLAELVLQVRPEDAKAHFICGMASFNSGDAENARDHLERFVELAPDDPDAAIANELLSYSN